jgi:tungstate transport system ATP-binding protein
VRAAYRLRGVSYRYAGAPHPALAVDRLEIAAGEITAVTGPNGSGKSTLLHVLAFLAAPEAGRVELFGRDVAPGDAARARRRVGLVQQNPYLVRGTVADNVELGLRVRRVPRAERRAAAAHAMEALGLTPLAHRSARNLSGGEAQKAALARVLVLEPDVLLLDEPFTHLDREYVAEMERLVTGLCRERGRTVVFTGHDPARARGVADRVCGLVAGKVVPASPLNLLRGRLDRPAGVFDTGRLRIHVPEDSPDGGHLVIEPNRIVLSTTPLDSSMRNAFPGRVTALGEHGGRVRVTVDAGEALDAEVTPDSVALQGLRPGTAVWVSFKSTAVTVF